MTGKALFNCWKVTYV